MRNGVRVSTVESAASWPRAGERVAFRTRRRCLRSTASPLAGRRRLEIRTPRSVSPDMRWKGAREHICGVAKWPRNSYSIATMAIDRKTVSLTRSGGSRSAVLPKSWLDQMGATDTVDLVWDDGRILIESTVDADDILENDPHFGTFLEFILRQALEHPGALTPATRPPDADDLTVGISLDC